MGGCLSAVSAPQHLIEQVNGNEDDYHKQYLEGRLLGEGEFGVVKLVQDVTSNTNQNEYACKVLRKGVVFKDNVLYSPIKPEVLCMEIDILRTLAGKCYCLKLCNIFESTRSIYIITEYCSGGEMMNYISNLMKQSAVVAEESAVTTPSPAYDLRSDDVSRIAFQLLSAVHHCCKHHIIHRDIKPENSMFQTPLPGAELRLIDFGSSVMDQKDNSTHETDNNGLYKHQTFAGSAFYISPEMFQRDYTVKTDVWSTGVTIYVLVAGYPADCLQKAFNILQKKERNLKDDLPNMPQNMPDSFYDLMEKLLVYRHTKRCLASDVIQHEFLQLHKKPIDVDEIETSTKTNTTTTTLADENIPRPLFRVGSVSLMSSALRHTQFLDFKKFERSLTTLLATLLSKAELDQLVGILSSRATASMAIQKEDMLLSASLASKPMKQDTAEEKEEELCLPHQQILSVCLISELKNILQDEMSNTAILETMARMPNAELFDKFAYHVELLVVFSSNETAKAILTGISNGDHSTASSHRKSIPHNQQSLRRRGSFRRTHSYTNNNATKMSGVATASMTGSIGSTHSATSFRGRSLYKKKTTASKSMINRPKTTVQGSNSGFFHL